MIRQNWLLEEIEMETKYKLLVKGVGNYATHLSNYIGLFSNIVGTSLQRRRLRTEVVHSGNLLTLPSLCVDWGILLTSLI